MHLSFKFEFRCSVGEKVQCSNHECKFWNKFVDIVNIAELLNQQDFPVLIQKDIISGL